MGLIRKIVDGLKKSQAVIGFKLKQLFKVGIYDNKFFDSIEEILLSADVGVTTTLSIIDQLRSQLSKNLTTSPDEAYSLLKEMMSNILVLAEDDYTYPLVILVSGVNGVGKTTTVGKLANLFHQSGKSVLIAAADTFRAAASEQLEIWAQRSDVRIVKQGEGADAAAVVFDAICSAKSKNTDVVIVDTAGRLHNKVNLMEELKKINRLIDREMPRAAKLNLIVLDATTGQNALSQVKIFNEALDIDGIILTKLDGTAKGGIIFTISQQFDLPIYYVGVGEGIDDLVPFDAKSFISGIFD